jgi:hypothetical protein
MKVLHQIIDYLRGRGLLTQEQLADLASQGILRWDEVYSEPPEPPAEADEDSSWLRKEEIEEPAERRGARCRRGASGARVPLLRPEELCQRLREGFGGWRATLDSLVALDSSAGGWEQVTVAIRNAATDDLLASLAAALRGHSLTLACLWEALQLDGYREILSGPESHGPTGAAYRALLAAPDLSGLGRYSALVREPEVAAVVNLMRAQRRLLQACGELLRRQPDLVAAAIRRDAGVPAYWAFVLLYSARRGATGRRPWPAADEHPPRHAAPADQDWPHLWSQAVAMDGRAVTPFLVERTRLQGDRPRALGEALAGLIAEQPDKPRTVLFNYFSRVWPLDRAAGLVGWPEAQAAAVLQDFRRDLRQALSSHPATRVFLQPAAARSLDAFLAECLGSTWDQADYCFNCHRENRYVEAIRTYYGPAFDLLCPRSWN